MSTLWISISIVTRMCSPNIYGQICMNIWNNEYVWYAFQSVWQKLAQHGTRHDANEASHIGASIATWKRFRRSRALVQKTPSNIRLSCWEQLGWRKGVVICQRQTKCKLSFIWSVQPSGRHRKQIAYWKSLTWGRCQMRRLRHGDDDNCEDCDTGGWGGDDKSTLGRMSTT